jgi:hypothetical protein
MFSPFAMNASAAGQALLARRGAALPAPDALLSGREFAERYLAPLAEALDAPVHVHAEVCSIARMAALKTEKIAAPERSLTPFRLLVRENGRERYVFADLLFDCTGTFRTPNPLGDCGQPALGESAAAGAVSYGVARANGFAGGRLLVVGGGHSAATAVCDFAGDGQNEVTWVRRSRSAAPCPRIAGDPLPARDALAAEVNALCESGRVRQITGAVVESLQETSGDLVVTLSVSGKAEPVEVHADHVICATGFRPDPLIARELHVQTCWATEGTYPLAASLLGETGGDCLAIPALGADTLRHPEPGYFALGMKSYGRTPDFLLRTGLAQIESVLEWLQ